VPETPGTFSLLGPPAGQECKAAKDKETRTAKAVGGLGSVDFALRRSPEAIEISEEH